ncbi:MAG: DUF362 domain-containing protein [Promethearchaeota archaeon]
MTASDVFYFNARVHSHLESLAQVKSPIALEEVGFPTKLKGEGNKVCIKTHFGALGNVRYIRPNYLRFLCDKVKEAGGDPVLAESCGVGFPSLEGQYAGRETEANYLHCAKLHGFTEDTMGAPIIMLDGELGLDYIVQPIDTGLRFSEVLVAGRLREFDYLVMASHYKGHIQAGFGGAIKNLGIGCAAKGGKAEAHTSKRMDIDSSKCRNGCTKCVDECPTGALSKGDGNVITRDDSKCRKCRWCHSLCPEKVFSSDKVDEYQFIEQMVDNARGVVDFFGKKRIFYINFAIDICPECDCSSASDVPIVPDIGILASTDPVALDQACVDLTHASPLYPNSKVAELGVEPGMPYLSYLYSESLDDSKDNWEHQLKAAEQVGLGKREYNLVEMD